MEVDWDLQAVVRGFTTTTTTSTTTNTNSNIKSDLTCFDTIQGGHLFTLGDPFQAKVKGDIGELHELFRPLFPKSQPLHSLEFAPISSISSPSVSREKNQPKQHIEPCSHQKHDTTSASSTTPRSKRRKNQVKKVCHIPAEALSSDVWAWRKYGQKPIKGSPYPRGYYRCSSLKGCLARKQVERDRANPRMFIVTYTDEHNHPAPNHRHSLAGSTRHKTSTTPHTDSDKLLQKTSPKPECSVPEEEILPLSSNTESGADEEGQEAEEFGGVSGMEISDDFFEGLEQLACPNNSGERFPDNFIGSFGLPDTTSTGGV